MDLRLFHPVEYPDRNFKMLDRLNSRTSHLSCRWLDFMGWYISSASQLLLGHYRFFQLYKKHHSGRSLDIPVVHGYILQRQTFLGVRFLIHRYVAIFAKIWGWPYRDMEILIINKKLLHEKAPILREFLTNAETGFDAAFKHAIQQIHDASFLASSDVSTTPTTVATEAIRGKEKGVFSKKQVLLLFDLLAQSAKTERLDLQRPNKADSLAQFLQALTGKSKDTWLEELKDYRNKDLYEFHTSGELNQLLSTLTNLSDILRAAGLRSISSQADKKIRELEAKK